MTFVYLPRVTEKGLQAVARELCQAVPPGRRVSFGRAPDADSVFMEFVSEAGRDVVVVALDLPRERFKTEAELHDWMRATKANIDGAKRKCAEVDVDGGGG